jgi:hypothetical protein
MKCCVKKIIEKFLSTFGLNNNTQRIKSKRRVEKESKYLPEINAKQQKKKVYFLFLKQHNWISRRQM